ncbi:hypothetical protein CEP52_009174 [Fusarium oligoseptatum]|uniref:ABM domain-containing protein n=3 Tax=Fusarium solani species complex TaxID=232080 RepID=A0A428TE47_9HYPO|nr:hypothetical protein CEP51_009651 [Fusarium floridanum]RSL83052.1 hypothetical protein CDV31_016876 [Fusarium ambrosium]RSM00314.1 hypothetical protein CEP52_009174 [Fusarium oligoseptatum]
MAHADYSCIHSQQRFNKIHRRILPRQEFNSYLGNLFIMVYTIVVHLYAKDDQECIDKLSAKLIEASRVYSKDQETISWFVMQDIKDPRAFTIVERYEQESSQKYHLENPYWKTFDPYVIPLLEKPMDLRRLEELDTSKDVVVPE